MEENICNYISDKETVSGIYKQVLQLNNEITEFFKWAKYPNVYFSKEDIQIISKHMKKCSKSLVIRKMLMKSTIRYQFTALRWLESNNLCLLMRLLFYFLFSVGLMSFLLLCSSFTVFFWIKQIFSSVVFKFLS